MQLSRCWKGTSTHSIARRLLSGSNFRSGRTVQTVSRRLHTYALSSSYYHHAFSYLLFLGEMGEGRREWGCRPSHTASATGISLVPSNTKLLPWTWSPLYIKDANSDRIRTGKQRTESEGMGEKREDSEKPKEQKKEENNGYMCHPLCIGAVTNDRIDLHKGVCPTTI